ncbi:hypothetical protein B0H16DRAFT_1460892 [Mycena metata]|uniref:Uncharacterized protein n=1 Tax=Mycena metata TaxID=1033252 RepID=A0AAD7ITX3_9AGAR|nr:hypothetical protein B0H16DRAFT_1460892 [Mycena metata]
MSQTGLAPLQAKVDLSLHGLVSLYGNSNQKDYQDPQSRESLKDFSDIDPRTNISLAKKFVGLAQAPNPPPGDVADGSSPRKSTKPREDIVGELVTRCFEFVQKKAQKREPAILALRELVDLLSAPDLKELQNRSCALSDAARTDPDYSPQLLKLHTEARQLPGLSFDLKKWVSKLLKIPSAVSSFYAWALSSRRNFVFQWKLHIGPIPTPEYSDIWIPLQDNAAASSTDETLSLKGKVHSECAVVAWVAEHVDPDIQLHCLACWMWLGEFNDLKHPRLRGLVFDGSHGGLWAPALHESYQAELLQGMVTAVTYSGIQPTNTRIGVVSAVFSFVAAAGSRGQIARDGRLAALAGSARDWTERSLAALAGPARDRKWCR